MTDLREAVAKLYFARWSSGAEEKQYENLLDDGRQFYDSLLTLLSQHGVVQIDESQELPPILRFVLAQEDMPDYNFKRVHPLEGQGGKESDGQT